MPKVEPASPADIEVVPATPDRWSDVAQLLGEGREDVGCWCQPWRGDVDEGRVAPGCAQAPARRGCAAARVPRLPRRRAGRLGWRERALGRPAAPRLADDPYDRRSGRLGHRLLPDPARVPPSGRGDRAARRDRRGGAGGRRAGRRGLPDRPGRQAGRRRLRVRGPRVDVRPGRLPASRRDRRTQRSSAASPRAPGSGAEPEPRSIASAAHCLAVGSGAGCAR